MADFSVADEIRKLADLHQQGLLSDTEFEAQRTRLLGQALPTSADQSNEETLETPLSSADVATEAVPVEPATRLFPPPPTPTWPPPPAATAGSSSPIYKKWWVWTAIGLVVVVIIVIVAVSGGKTPRSNPSQSTTGTVPPNSQTQSTAPPDTTPLAPAPSVPSTFGGNAHPTLAPGQQGALDVVYVGTPYSEGPSDGTIVPVEVWNGTSQTVSSVDVSGSAMSGSTVVGSGDSQDVQPGNLASGQVAFGMVFYSQQLPNGVTFNLTATGSTGSSYRVDAQVVQANYSASGGIAGPGIVGSVTNQSSSTTITHPISTDLYCFSSGGTLLYVNEGFVSGDADLAPGATGSYSIDIPTDASLNPFPCTTYLVGSSG